VERLEHHRTRDIVIITVVRRRRSLWLLVAMGSLYRLAQAPATEAIKQLLLDAESVRLQEVARITQQLSAQPLSAEQLAGIDRLTKSLTAKLLHPQIAALRDRKDIRDEDENS